MSESSPDPRRKLVLDAFDTILKDPDMENIMKKKIINYDTKSHIPKDVLINTVIDKLKEIPDGKFQDMALTFIRHCVVVHIGGYNTEVLDWGKHMNHEIQIYVTDDLITTMYEDSDRQANGALSDDDAVPDDSNIIEYDGYSFNPNLDVVPLKLQIHFKETDDGSQELRSTRFQQENLLLPQSPPPQPQPQPQPQHTRAGYQHPPPQPLPASPPPQPPQQQYTRAGYQHPPPQPLPVSPPPQPPQQQYTRAGYQHPPPQPLPASPPPQPPQQQYTGAGCQRILQMLQPQSHMPVSPPQPPPTSPLRQPASPPQPPPGFQQPPPTSPLRQPAQQYTPASPTPSQYASSQQQAPSQYASSQQESPPPPQQPPQQLPRSIESYTDDELRQYVEDILDDIRFHNGYCLGDLVLFRRLTLPQANEINFRAYVNLDGYNNVIPHVEHNRDSVDFIMRVMRKNNNLYPMMTVNLNMMGEITIAINKISP
jgi:hypothetical protein